MQKKIVKREFISFFLERGIKTPDGTSGGQVLVAAEMHADAKLLRLCLVVKQSEEESWSLATWKYFQGEEYQSGNLGEWGKNKQTDKQTDAEVNCPRRFIFSSGHQTPDNSYPRARQLLLS